MKKRIKVQGVLIFLAILATISLSKSLFPYWKKEPQDEILDVLGIGFVLFGFLFRVSARGYKGEKSPDGKILIKDGPYGLIRNPMYFGTLLIGTGITFVIFQLWTLLLFWLIFLLIYVQQIKKEENVLSKRFAEEYSNYAKTVPKYLPYINNLLDIRKYIFLKLSWIKKELISLVLVISGIIAVEVWEDVSLFGYKEFIKEPLELLLIIVSFLIIICFFKKQDSSYQK